MGDRYLIDDVCNGLHFVVRHFRFSPEASSICRCKLVLKISLNILFSLMNSYLSWVNVLKILIFSFFDHFRLSISSPVTKIFFSRDLKTDKKLNNQTLRKYGTMYEDMLTMFCLIWRNFLLSQDVVKN